MLNLFGHTGRETTLRIRPDCFKCQKCGSFSFPLHFMLRYGNRPGKGI